MLSFQRGLALRLVIPALLIVAATDAAPARAECSIWGTVTAFENPGDPALGAWMYRLMVTWDTGSQYAMSHIDLLMDLPNGNCSCAQFYEAITWSDHIGSGLGDPLPCLLFYDGEILCDGDPSTGVEGTILKFEPREDEDCEPATQGTAQITFYSDYPPGPIAEPNMFLFDKFAGLICFGPASGQFPGLPCDPVATDQSTWGAIKTIYDGR
jgi:hypothetical protein